MITITFEALNLPPDHPEEIHMAYISTSSNILQRTPNFIRTGTCNVENQRPPIRIISPGCVYRSDAVDATHSPLFHQIEDLLLIREITMSDLERYFRTPYEKSFTAMTADQTQTSSLPFTEPVQKLMLCVSVTAKAAVSVREKVTLNFSVRGMVHPKVLEGCGIDSSVYSGFAFGMGLERIVMKI